MTEEKLNNELKKHSKDKIKAVKDNATKFVKIYNTLCMPCRLKAMRKPNTNYRGYCDKCKKMMCEVWGK